MELEVRCYARLDVKSQFTSMEHAMPIKNLSLLKRTSKVIDFKLFN